MSKSPVGASARIQGPGGTGGVEGGPNFEQDGDPSPSSRHAGPGVEEANARASGPGVREQLQQLMRVMGRECLFPRPKCRVPSLCHKKYPSLLKEVVIDRPGQVWSTAIPDGPMP